jgi:hypothetical protein
VTFLFNNLESLITDFGSTGQKDTDIEVSGIPRNFVLDGGDQQIQLRTGQSELGSGGCSPLVGCHAVCK